MAGLALAVALTILGSAGGCAEVFGEASPAALDESFQLRVGQSTVVEPEALEIGFEAVSGDSRCAKGEVCIWEGDATVRIWIQGGAGAKVERELHTSSKGPGAADYESWSIRLVTLAPYPITGRSIPQAEYVVTLEMTRGSSADSAIQ